MNADYLYGIFEITEKNNFPDLTHGLAVLRNDQPILPEEARAIRMFLGRHYDALSMAYKKRNRLAFADVVAVCEDKDKEAMVK